MNYIMLNAHPNKCKQYQINVEQNKQRKKIQAFFFLTQNYKYYWEIIYKYHQKIYNVEQKTKKYIKENIYSNPKSSFIPKSQFQYEQWLT